MKRHVRRNDSLEDTRCDRVFRVHGTALALWRAVAIPWPQPVESKKFKLTYGHQFELCRAFKKNLSAFPNLSDKTYEWPLDPKLKDFSTPQWHTVYIQEHMDIIKTLEFWNYDPLDVNHEFADESWERDLQRLPEEVANGHARLDVAHFDFDHGGRIDTDTSIVCQKKCASISRRSRRKGIGTSILTMATLRRRRVFESRRIPIGLAILF